MGKGEERPWHLWIRNHRTVLSHVANAAVAPTGGELLYQAKPKFLKSLNSHESSDIFDLEPTTGKPEIDKIQCLLLLLYNILMIHIFRNNRVWVS